MQGFGYLLVAVGMWVTYCGYMGLDALKTIVQIIQNPAQAQQIIAAGANKLGGDKQANAANANGSSGNIVVDFARSQIGKPYRLGGAGPDTWDCSGLTMKAYALVGIKLAHTSSLQLLVGKRISRKQDLMPGDLLFPSLPGTLVAGHVQIYSGGNNIIEAARPGTNVRERTMWGFSGDKVRASRPLG